MIFINKGLDRKNFHQKLKNVSTHSFLQRSFAVVAIFRSRFLIQNDHFYIKSLVEMPSLQMPYHLCCYFHHRIKKKYWQFT